MGANTFLGNHAKFTYASVDMSGDFNSLDVDFKTPYVDSSCFGDDWETGVSGLGAYTITAAGFVNKTAGANDDTFFSRMGGSGSQATTWVMGMAGSTAGYPKYSGSGIATDMKEGVKIKSLATISISLQGVGTPVRGLTV